MISNKNANIVIAFGVNVNFLIGHFNFKYIKGQILNYNINSGNEIIRYYY